MKAVRFIRRPFVVLGYQVTADNMEEIATWCRGHVIPADEDRNEKAFVRVPVDRPTNQKQTQAFVTDWVILAFNQRNEESFKVYPQDWLRKNFVPLPREAEESRLYPARSSDDDEQESAETDCNCTPASHCNSSNVRSLPTQGGNRTVVNGRTPR